MDYDPSHEEQEQRIRLWTQQLYKDYQTLCYQFRLRLRTPLIRILNFKTLLGQWDPETRCISISRTLVEKHDWDVVLEVLKHEMAHQIVSDVFYSSDHHGPRFREACQILGVSGWAIRACSNPEKPIPHWKETAADDPNDRLLAKVEKLLALASSDNENEALLAMQRVQELYTKYNIQRIGEQLKSNHVYLIIDRKRKRIERFESKICSILTAHFFVEIITWSRYNADALGEYKVIELLGAEKNVLMAEYVYHFLFRKLHSLWDNYRKITGKPPKSKLSYMMGVLEGFDSKLTDSKQSLVGDPDSKNSPKQPGNLMIIKDKELRAFVKSRYPRIIRSSWGSRFHDRQSFSAGTNEGKRLTIHKVVTQSISERGLLPSR